MKREAPSSSSQGGSSVAEIPAIGIVVPCYNEAEVIRLFYEELTAILSSITSIEYRIIFVDDGSVDETLEILNELARSDGAIEIRSLSRNFGHQVALSAGLDAAVGSNTECERFDAVIMMDADTQHPPELIPRFVEAWRSGADVVSAVRKATENASRWKSFSSQSFYWLINRLSETHIEPGAADFCLLSARACKALCSMPERHRFLRGMVSWIGFRREYIPFEAPPRPAGESKYTTLRMMRLALDATFSFSSIPLRFATRIGVFVLFMGAIYLTYAVIRHFTVGDLVPGWASLLSSVLILGGTQLVCLGLIGEYLARMFEEAKGRPLYFLKQDTCPTSNRLGSAEQSLVNDSKRRTSVTVQSTVAEKEGDYVSSH